MFSRIAIFNLVLMFKKLSIVQILKFLGNESTIIDDFKKLYGIKVSTKVPDKIVPAPKKYKAIFVEGTFPCLFNGNPEEKNGAIYYPKVSTKKGETEADYDKLHDLAGVGTRLLRMVTVTISEV